MVPPVPPISPSHAGRRKTGRPIAQSDSASHQRGGQGCNAPSSLVQSSQSHEGRRPVLVDNGRNVRSCRSESAQEQGQAVISRLHGKREERRRRRRRRTETAGPEKCRINLLWTHPPFPQLLRNRSRGSHCLCRHRKLACTNGG